MMPHRKDIRTAENGVHLEHRHFAFIASVLASLPKTHPLSQADIVGAFADACAHTNTNFSRSRFLAAARGNNP